EELALTMTSMPRVAPRFRRPLPRSYLPAGIGAVGAAALLVAPPATASAATATAPALPGASVAALPSGTVIGIPLNAPVVGAAQTAAGAYMVASDGGVFTVGGAPYFGSMGNHRLNAPIVAMAATPSGAGYW